MTSVKDAAAARAAVVAAAVMIAHQIAGKATRDALFLGEFPISALPPMVITNSLVSVVVAIIVARYLARRGPGAVLPASFTASGVLFLIELAGLASFPGAVAIALQLHMAAIGGIVVSTFWALVNERFDPHTAKKQVNRIVAGASLGGLLGGLLAERVGAFFGLAPMLPILGALHFFCAWRVRTLRVPEHPAPAGAAEAQSGFQHLAAMPYLRNLALLLLLTTIAAAFIDFVFKAEAALWFDHDGDSLLRFFALFSIATSLLSFIAQALFVRQILQKLGLVKTAAALPLGVLGVGAMALAAPGVMSAAALRGIQDVTRNSLFRSAYELLYNPLPRAAKRATKLLIDVGADRLGDAVGAGIIAALLLSGPELALVLLVWGAMLLAAGTLFVSVRLHRGYVNALEKSLLTQAEALDIDALRDSTTRLTMLQTLGTLDLPEALKRRRAEHAAANAAAAPPRAGSSPTTAPRMRTTMPPPGPATDDPVLAQVASLQSGDRARVEATLARSDLDPTTAPHVISLLAWDDVHALAIATLRRLGARITGQLSDALLDKAESFAVRRRVPRALHAGDPRRARAALIAGLADVRFEVRYQCARALHRIAPDAEAGGDEDPAAFKREIYAVAARELDVGDKVWTSHRLLDVALAEEAPLIDEGLAPLVDRGLEHVFNLIALVLPRRPVRVAFHGLMTDDDVLRGTALEYLDSALPEHLRSGIRRVAGSRDRRAVARESERSPDEVAARLVESMPTIEVHLKALLARRSG